MKLMLRALSALFLLSLLSADFILRAGAPKSETVEFKSGNDTISGFLALPDGPGPHAAIVVIHEWWGLNDWVKEQAEKIAGLGYLALAGDLYRGKAAADATQAHELKRGLAQDRGVKDLRAAVPYLNDRKAFKSHRIG